jgi:myo-inositol 2-dehydrogenase/D-chiro-inositol 1-dehydrogenase
VKLKIGFLGAGYISGVHRRNLADDERVEVVSIYDTDRARAGALAADSADEVFAKCDAVYVTAPNYLHASLALRAVQAGKHVFCEKPMATSLDAARDILDAAESAKRVFQVGHNRRFAKVYKRVKELLGQSAPHAAHIKMNRGELLRPVWSGDPAVTGGFLFETPIHMLDMMRFLIGEVVWLQARESRENDFSVLLEFKTGMHATFVTSADASWFFPFERWEIFGEYSTIETGEMETLSYRLGLDSPTCSEHFAALSIEEKWGFAEEDRRFVDAILGGTPAAVTALDGYRAVELAAACYQSARERRPIDLSR